jgi:hypothetical protein
VWPVWKVLPKPSVPGATGLSSGLPAHPAASATAIVRSAMIRLGVLIMATPPVVMASPGRGRIIPPLQCRPGTGRAIGPIVITCAAVPLPQTMNTAEVVCLALMPAVAVIVVIGAYASAGAGYAAYTLAPRASTERATPQFAAVLKFDRRVDPAVAERILGGRIAAVPRCGRSRSARHLAVAARSGSAMRPSTSSGI